MCQAGEKARAKALSSVWSSDPKSIKLPGTQLTKQRATRGDAGELDGSPMVRSLITQHSDSGFVLRRRKLPPPNHIKANK